VRLGLLAISIPVLPLIVGCERPDASHVTSPSAQALAGTTVGNVAYRPEDTPPAEVDGPEGWDLRFENARFSELENGDESIQVVLQVESEPGPVFEIWLEDAEGTVLRWSGGSARAYDGVVCFQLRLEADGEALPLGDGPFAMTIAFRDVDAPQPVTAQTLAVTGRPPRLEGAAPSQNSPVARDLLGCPRSVI
jgi:hypothetical protein